MTRSTMSHVTRRLELEAYWMPFTANRAFKANPRLLVSAEGMHYTTHDGRRILDAVAGLWCVNAGHGRREITEAVQRQIAELDYAPGFQMGHPGAFEVASRLARMAPGSLNHVFFTNSGSESVDTALKIALAYHRVRGEGARRRLIGRERGYHGVGFGGISVGGIPNNRRFFGSFLSEVDHLPHTHDLEHNAFTRGEPEWGGHFANALESLVALHDASTMAAVIVEPVAGSTGVLIPPRGYLRRLREICDEHGLLLIFDEVITGFGRLGATFDSQYFDVVPDMITLAKGLTNGSVPMGAVLIRDEIYEAFMTGPSDAIELFHGYTYSGHPLACAAANAALDVYEAENLFTRAAELSGYWEESLHNLRELPHVIDIRNLGLMGAIELEPIEGQPTKRGSEAFLRAFEKGVLIRTTGDTIAFSPPLIVERTHIHEIMDIVREVLKRLP